MDRAVAHFMNGETFQCTAVAFLKEYNPCSVAVKKRQIEECKSELKLKGILKAVDGYLTWATYQRPSDTVRVSNDNSPYVDIGSMVHEIWAYAESKNLKRNNFDFKEIADNHIDPILCRYKRKKNACILEIVCQGIAEANNIVMPVEFMNRGYDPENAMEVRERVVGECHRIMQEDPRRMFIYALTVEDDMMSAWYFSRTHSVMSKSFNWVNKDIDTFIHLMLSFALSTPKELGIDPRIHKPCVVAGEQKQQYVYEVGVEPTDVFNKKSRLFYKTIESLSVLESHCISGRMTRIWLVKQVPTAESDDRVEGTKNMVLKDVWLDSSARTEAQNMDDMFMAVDNFITKGLGRHPGPDAMSKFIKNEPRLIGFGQAARDRMQYLFTDKNYRKLFLTKLLAWGGETLRIRGPSTREPSMPIFPELNTVDNPTLKETAGLTPKTQRRFLYEEVCIPLCDLPNFGVAMDVLSGAREALSILYCAGWVHRDVSTGNILAVASDNNGKTTYQPKLSDLEFAQPQGHTSDGTDHCMGTRFFMPLETMEQRYLFKDRAIDDDDIDDYISIATKLKLMPDHPHYNVLKKYIAVPAITHFPEDSNNGSPSATMLIPLSTDPVIHNYHHDLESLWWILLYLITVCANHEPSINKAEMIFRYGSNFHARSYVFSSYPGDVYPTIGPILRSVFLKHVEDLRKRLYACCIARPLFGQLHIPEAFSAIHGTFATSLDGILRSKKVNWRAVPLGSPWKVDALKEKNIGASKKRPAVEIVARRKRAKHL